jgi:hypothetical protein
VPKIQLPDGCYSLNMANGKRYDAAKPGGTVEVSSKDAHYISTSFYGQTGIMRGSEQFAFRGRSGRWCTSCKRLWHAWSHVCPRCGADTTPTGGTE